MTKSINPFGTSQKTASRRSSVGESGPRSLSTSLFDSLLDQFLELENGHLRGMMKTSMDVAETDHAFEVTLDLPGITPDDVDIQIDNNMLTVRGRRNEEQETRDEQRHYHRVERLTGSFCRSVNLSKPINEDETVAEFRDGVLKITIPKSETSLPRKIKVNQ